MNELDHSMEDETDFLIEEEIAFRKQSMQDLQIFNSMHE